MDQLPYLNQQLSSNPHFDGQGQTFEVAGDLELPDNCVLENIKLIQIAPTETRRTIRKAGGSNVRLRNVVVNRGSNDAIGSLGDNAGIWLYNVQGVDIDDISVTGHGSGAGISLHNLVRPTLGRIRVENMRYSAPSDPGTEKILGIWINNCSHFTLPAPVIHDLYGMLNGVKTATQTDGISISGCSDFSILGPQISSVCEGIDITGSAGNARFSIIGGNIKDVYAYGVKLANSASFGIIEGVTVKDAGYVGFVVGGPTEVNIPKPYSIKMAQCMAIDTGSNGKWSTYTTCGFAVMQGSVDQAFPMGVSFIDCEAFDTQATKTMKYGYRNEPAQNSTHPNRKINCRSIGHTIAENLGTFV